MRRAAPTAGRAVLLAGPVALAFFAGGYFGEPRAWAGLAAWSIVAVCLALTPRPLPRSLPGMLAAAGLVAFAAWTLLSAAWAPLAGPAYHDGERVFLYAGALLAAVALLRDRRALRWVEPALTGGAVIVIGYGLSERFFPGLVHLHRTPSAGGRLEQPLTYWNAMGTLAAIGIVLAARVAGDRTRPAALRAAAAAAAAPLGMGLYLTLSRAGAFACAAGLIVLAVAAPQRAQLRAMLVTVAAAGAGALAAAPFPGVTRFGAHGEAEGAVAFVLLGAIVVTVVAVQSAVARRDPAGDVRLPRHAGWIAVGAIVAIFAVFLAVGSREKTGARLVNPSAHRFTTLKSNRYAYWRVAGRMWVHHPLAGEGASSFATEWQRRRTFAEGAHDAHSLYIETAAELGLIGLAALAAFLAGVGLAARAAHRASPALAAGAIAGVSVYAAHAAVDWDWEMPAVTLPALTLAAVLLVLSEQGYGVPGIVTRLRDAAETEGAAAATARLAGWGARYAAGLPLALAGTRRTFTLGGRAYRYLAHPYNFTWMHERAVEVPVVRAAVEAETGRVLEVGHVLGHYGVAGHEVVDKYETAPGVRNADVLDLDASEPYDLVVSISTLEHVGVDDTPADPARAIAAVANLRALLAPGGRLLVTVPVGYNHALQDAIRDGAFDLVRALTRDGGGMRWREADLAEVWGLDYDRLLFRARAVLVCSARA